MDPREHCVDVRSGENSVDRWSQALHHYHTECEDIRNGRVGGKVLLHTLVDVSGSMCGTKLIAVKLGLCALIANLGEDDEVNLMSFSDTLKNLTPGFVPVAGLKTLLPPILAKMVTDGLTSCYDATIAGIETLKNAVRPASGGDPASTAAEATKNVLIVLTDGEDTSSRKTAANVRRALCNPRFNGFMFVLLAIDMKEREELHFRNWMELSHCKQISVNVHSGSRLVQVFKEGLLSRVLHSDLATPRFLHIPPGADGEDDAGDEGDADDVPTFAILREDLLRQMASTPFDGGDELFVATRCYSNNVSRRNSETDSDRGGDWGRDLDGDVDMGRGWDMRSVGSVGSADSFDEPVIFSLGRSLSRDSFDMAPAPMINSLGLIVDEIDNGGRPFNPSNPDPTAAGAFGCSATSSVSSPASPRSSPSPSPSDLKDAGSVASSSCISDGRFAPECFCPITHAVMRDPVMCADGHTYERDAIEKWLRTNVTSPVTNLRLPHRTLMPNHALRGIIQSIL